MGSNCVFTYTGGASNADPNASFGGIGSSVQLNTISLHNLFDPVIRSELVGQDSVNYRAIDILNNGDTDALQVQFFVVNTVNAESAIAIWYEDTPGQSIPDEDTPPFGAVWTQPLVGSRQSIDPIAINGRARIWIRRTVNEDAPGYDNDLGTLKVWFAS